EELNYDTSFKHVGLKLKIIRGDAIPTLGLDTESDGSFRVVSAIKYKGAAYKSGFMVGDILLAIDDERVVQTTIASRLGAMQIGVEVDVTVVRDDRIITIPLTLGAHQPTNYKIIEDPQADPGAVALRKSWLKPYVMPFN
ncbi:MAG: PDZ domain-containing protein, partial [Gemmatimonadota bacterium]|nr:PDZ domain-containing protein [Gemmatimonadota bacterium]